MPDEADSDESLGRTYYLVRRAQAGEEGSLDELVTRYHDRVLRIVRARLGPRLRARLDSDDICQETFAAAIQTFDRFEMRSEASLIHWLARIAETAIQRQAEHHGAEKRRAVEQSLDGSQDHPLVTDSRGPASRAADEEERERLEDAVAALPEAYREVIVLRDFAGMSWRQVADEMERPSEDAARVLYGRAIAALDKHLHPDS